MPKKELHRRVWVNTLIPLVGIRLGFRVLSLGVQERELSNIILCHAYIFTVESSLSPILCSEPPGLSINLHPNSCECPDHSGLSLQGCHRVCLSFCSKLVCRPKLQGRLPKSCTLLKASFRCNTVVPAADCIHTVKVRMSQNSLMLVFARLPVHTPCCTGMWRNRSAWRLMLPSSSS